MKALFCEHISFLLLLTGQWNIWQSSASKTSNLFNLTESQQEILHEFQNAVKDLTYKDFMKSDAYNVRWLMAADFHVNEAVNRFNKSLAWRKEKNVDAIPGENYTFIDEAYPFVMEGTDNDGRPLVMAHGGIMDFRKIALSGKQSTYKRYCIRLAELAEEYMHYLRVATGRQNLTQFTAIVDLTGFNLKTTACLKCLALLPEIILNFVPNYPELLHRVFFINTPRLFEVVKDVARPLLPEKLRKIMEVLGFDKTIWQATLLEHIPADQLPIKYGGTKEIRFDQSSLLYNQEIRNLLGEWAAANGTVMWNSNMGNGQRIAKDKKRDPEPNSSTVTEIDK